MIYADYNVQIIGAYLDPLVKILNRKKIGVDSIISGCNPLAMAGNMDPAYAGYCEEIHMKVPSLLNIRKNLGQMLSHEAEGFCQNVNLQPFGREVRYRNISDYIIVFNAGCAYSLYEKNGTVYSDLWPQDEFVKAIKKDGTYVKRVFPFSGDFNWRYYYEKFVNVVLKEFDSRHIILVRTNVAQWYMEGCEVNAFDEGASRMHRLMMEMDEYFIEKTDCYVIDRHFSQFPPQKMKCAFPNIQMSQHSYEGLADDIWSIIQGKVGSGIGKYIPSHLSGRNELAVELQRKLSAQICAEKAGYLQEIEQGRMSFSSTGIHDFNKNTLFQTIWKLKRFLEPGSSFTLSDYVLDLLKGNEYPDSRIDFPLVKLYTKYFKLDLNDIIAVYMLARECEDRSVFRDIVENIICNSGSLPVTAAREAKENNIRFLEQYPYLPEKYKGKDGGGGIYIRLENNSYLLLDAESEEPIVQVTFDIKESVDYLEIIKNGCICRIGCADALTYCFEYYAEKAREGYGEKPTYLVFDSAEEFFESLYYINYADLLRSERFVFVIGAENRIPLEAYKPIVDFSELIDSDTVIVRMQNGYGDQFCHFMYGQAIGKITGRKVFYYDLPCGDFGGDEFARFAKVPVNLISRMLSPRLREIDPWKCSKVLYLTVLNQYNYVIPSHEAESFKKETFGGRCGYYCCDDLERYLNIKLPFSYYFGMIRLEMLESVFRFQLRDYIEFPPLEKQEHLSISSQMSSCDSVVIHVRCGDYISWGWDVECSYYAEVIKNVMELSAYKNKKFFVFSDDIKWCKDHEEQIGLNQTGDCGIVFVEGNKNQEIYRDMQLMALGKIMIMGSSYFPCVAAMYSDTLEMMFCSSNSRSQAYQKYVRKNKYETKPLSRNFDPDRSKKIPRAYR